LHDLECPADRHGSLALSLMRRVFISKLRSKLGGLGFVTACQDSSATRGDQPPPLMLNNLTAPPELRRTNSKAIVPSFNLKSWRS